MRLKIALSNNRNTIKLPQHYNSIIQGFIYRNLDRAMAERLHEQGYKYEKRRFKLFTFSKVFGKFTKEENNLLFRDRITFYISSPITDILESFAFHLVQKKYMLLNRQRVILVSIEVVYPSSPGTEILIKTMSPITVYSTLLKKDGKKKAYYYSPFEDDFSKLIRENLLKKFTILHREYKEQPFTIEPEKVNKRNEHIVYFKNTVIKAWSGIYRLKGTEDLIKIGYETGLGAKNSQGFGMIEIIK